MRSIESQERWLNYQAQKNLTSFINLIVKDDKGQFVDSVELHRQWHWFIEECLKRGSRRILIMSPRRFAKTVQMLGVMMYFLVQDRNRRMKIICNDDPSAIKRTTSIKNYIEKDQEIKKYFGNILIPDSQSKWTQHSILIKRDSISIDQSIESHGIFTTGVGGSCDVMLLDDICDYNNSVDSPVKREKVKQMLLNTWLTQLEPQSICICIGTAWHIDDANHMLLDNPAWSYLIQRVRKDFKKIEQIHRFAV